MRRCRRSQEIELVEILTRLNALEGEFWKSDQKIVMDEELVQNGVMDGKFVKNFVMDAEIDPKVVMDLSIFKIGGWNSLQPINLILLEELLMRMNRGCRSEFQAEIHSM